MHRGLLFLFILLFSYALKAQTDSLYSEWQNKENADTIRLDAFKKYIWEAHMFTNPDTALILSKEFYAFAKKSKETNLMGAALNHQAVALSILGREEESLNTYLKAIDVYVNNGHASKAAATYSNLATVYQNRGDYKQAAEKFFKALGIFEKENNKERMATVKNNLGVLYNQQKMYAQALKYYREALDLRLELNMDDENIGMSYMNLGAIYGDLEDYDQSIAYYNKSLDYFKKSNSILGTATYYLNMGHIANENNKIEQSLDFYLKALENFEQIDDVKKISIAEVNVGSTYAQLGERELALMYLVDAFKRSRLMGLEENSATGALALYQIYKADKDYENALRYFEVYHDLNDSLNSINSKEATINLQFQYEYDKKAIIDSLEFEKSQALNILEISKQKAALAKAETERYALFGGIALLLLFGLFVLRSYRRKKRDHDIISDQHQLLSLSHNEIRQSIDYAKRLQDTILPTKETLRLHFQDYFVLFKPKDVVSGDFYWFEYDAKTDTRLFAVADCTGHGVPGAMVSLVCATALNRVVNELGILEPAEILNKAREIIIETFSKREQHLRDGMDITLCAVDAQNNCTVAGATNALWVVSKNSRKKSKSTV
jgi:tetratricopeptide (TPR) repeat protein